MTSSRDRLHSAGLKATGPRVSVFEALRDEGGHQSANHLSRLLASAGARLSRASIFNALGDLARTGLVARIDRGPGPALYEIAGAPHHHFVCRRCGTIVDVFETVGPKPCLGIDLPGVTIEQRQVIFRGLCPACAGKDANRP